MRDTGTKYPRDNRANRYISHSGISPTPFSGQRNVASLHRKRARRTEPSQSAFFVPGDFSDGRCAQLQRSSLSRRTGRIRETFANAVSHRSYVLSSRGRVVLRAWIFTYHSSYIAHRNLQKCTRNLIGLLREKICRMKFTRDVDAGETSQMDAEGKNFSGRKRTRFSRELWTRTEFAGAAECNGKETEEEREESGREYESG